MLSYLPRRLLAALESEELLVRVAQLVVFISVALALPSLLIPLGLPPEGDAIDYRIPLVRWILRHGQYPNWPWTMVDDYPMLGELLMTPLYWLSPGLARLVPIGAFVGFGWAAGSLARLMGEKCLSPRALFWVGFAWAINLRPVAIQSNLLMIDNLAGACLLGSFTLVLAGRMRWAGGLAAAALATRYTVWGAVAALPFFVLWFSDPGKRWRNCFQFCALAGLGALPFLLRNFMVNQGNPFFPFGNEAVMRDLGPTINGYGRGHSLGSLLLFPFDLLYTNSFVRGFYDYTVGKLFYLQLFAALVAGMLLRRTFGAWRKREWALLAFALIQFLIWFKTGQQLRFLTPALMIFDLALLTVAARSRPLTLALTALACFSALSIQKDSLLMAVGKRPSMFAEQLARAEDCFRRAGTGGDPVAYVSRESVQGFLDQDFYFLPPNPYAISGGLSEAPRWIYSTQPQAGYELFPPQNPCLLKKI